LNQKKEKAPASLLGCPYFARHSKTKNKEKLKKLSQNARKHALQTEK
jgi:hypothetical protein